MSSIYNSPRLAAGYAYGRPPVHRSIIQKLETYPGMPVQAGRALDVGCGGGLSTAAIAHLAGMVVGLEPVAAMLAHAGVVAPRARFLVGQAERLPFRDGTFNLLTAAGSLNYADLRLFLPEAARVLAPGGVLAIYDYATGRRLRGSDRLDKWYGTFEHRYPSPPGRHLDPGSLAYASSGLRLETYEQMEVGVSMTFSSYLKYVMTETKVELAISRGTREAEIEDWCRATLEAILEDGPFDVVFDAYIACVGRIGDP
jgi:ubiquinone/menaquinone biosynthesis C-methylase UbiE